MLIILQKEYILLILDGLDVEAKGRADDTGVLPIDLQHNRRLTRIIQAPESITSLTHRKAKRTRNVSQGLDNGNPSMQKANTDCIQTQE